MRIVHVAEWNELSGGAYTVVNNLISNSLKINSAIDFHVVSFADTNEILHMQGYTVHLVKKVSFPTSGYWYSYKSIQNKIIEINPDIVHLHFTYPPYSPLAKMPFPIVITTHGLASIKVKRSHAIRAYLNLSFFLNPFFEKEALKNADSIIAVSKWIKNEVELAIGPNPKIIYLPNGINFSALQEGGSKFENPSVSHPSLFFIGRLIKFKGVDLLISSLYYVKKQVPDIHLYVAGQGPQASNLKKLAQKLGLESNITFLGFLSEHDKQVFLHECDVFVIPSRYETFGIVVLEALEAGIPVVASNVGGIPDILEYGKYGILFNQEDVQDMARCILLLLSNTSMKKELSEKGMKRVLDYSWEIICKQTLDLYSSLLKP
ncbi:glycosyl transferase, group 1 [Methanolobus psychrophilus R15]|nr:glycosyl transferase, group 1 [Methanolobus psychrophilus R15]